MYAERVLERIRRGDTRGAVDELTEGIRQAAGATGTRVRDEVRTLVEGLAQQSGNGQRQATPYSGGGDGDRYARNQVTQEFAIRVEVSGESEVSEEDVEEGLRRLVSTGGGDALRGRIVNVLRVRERG